MLELVEKASKNCSDAELFVKKLEDYPVVFEANKLKSVKSKLLQGYSLRTIKEGRMGFASSTDISGTKSDKLVDAALASSKFGPKTSYKFWHGRRFPSPKIFYPATVSFEIEDAENMGRKIVSRLNDMIPDAYIDVTVGRIFEEVGHYTPGCERIYYKSLFYLSVSAILVREGQMTNFYESIYGCGLPDNPDSLISEIVWKEKLSQNTVDVPSKKMPVIFSPKVVSLITEPLTTGLLGRHVGAKSSPLTGRIGEEILDPRFSMYDDALLDSGIESAPFDDEGVPRQRFPLFSKGILKNYFLDLATSDILQLDSTASASRCFLMPPCAAPSNIQIESGNNTFENMIEDIDEGLIIDQVIGGGQSNILNGEFSVNVELGYYIKNGKIVGRVRDCMIAGNVYDMLKSNLHSLGKQSYFAGSLLTPHICFKDVSVAGKA